MTESLNQMLNALESHLVDYPTPENIHMQRKYLSDIRQHLARTPDRDALIERLKGELEATIHLAQHSSEPGLSYVDGLLKAITIIRQHQAEQPTYTPDHLVDANKMAPGDEQPDHLPTAFEEWASKDPAYNIEKDGDGEYENKLTRLQYHAFEAGYGAGIWGAANKINGELCDEVGRLQAELIKALPSARERESVYLGRLKEIQDYAGRHIGCRCDKDDCDPGDCWPCRMMMICEMALPAEEEEHAAGESGWVEIEDFRGEPNSTPLAWWWWNVEPDSRPELDEILLDAEGKMCGKGGCGAQYFSHVKLAGFERPESPVNRRRGPATNESSAQSTE